MHDLALYPEYRTLALCAGAGGLELGVELARPGARCVAYVEREAYAASTLVARMEAGQLAPAPIWSDLATFDARPWRGRIHCITSGDPCQENSVAGKRLGAAGARFLAPEVVRIADECRPDRIFRENVSGNAAEQLDAIVPPLERLGYRVAAGMFSASGVGASHRRERLFIMADLGLGDTMREGPFPASQRGIYRCEEGAGTRNAQSQRRSGALGDACGTEIRSQGSRPHDRAAGGVQSEGNEWQRFRPDARQSGADLDAGSVADASRAGPQGRELSGTCDDERHGPNAHGSTSELCGAWLPLLCPGPSDARWPDIIARAPHLEPAIRRVADGLANRVDRLRLCGNGVHPLAAGYAWLALDALLADAAASDAAVRSAA
jgi:DNA (cytosine-5)-methyltransferase 1